MLGQSRRNRVGLPAIVHLRSPSMRTLGTAALLWILGVPGIIIVAFLLLQSCT